MTSEEIKSKVEKALDEIRPFLQSDGGDISLISIDNDSSVKVKTGGKLYWMQCQPNDPKEWG